jgi:formylglycine-generating enzyme required for sulfatase activity
VIESFQPSLSSVEMGTGLILETRFSGGTGVVGPQGAILQAGGSVAIRPTRTTTYTLTVTNALGQSVESQATVEVKPGLAVQVKGHEGMAGEVVVTGPGGYERILRTSAVLTGLEPGAYAVTASPVQHGGAKLYPWHPVQRVQVTTGTTVNVGYPAPALAVMLPGEVALELVLIPAGTFTMGTDTPPDPRRSPNPSPAHAVTIPKAFYMAKVPTTQAQWAALAGSNPSAQVNPRYAVASVSFDDIQQRFLPKTANLLPSLKLRLPSEAQWEYACRAGTTTAYFHGQDAAGLTDYAWSYEEATRSEHPVGQKRPNPWGLHDLAGLVFQWCEDIPHDGYLGAPAGGEAWFAPGSSSQPEHRILRGYFPLGAPGPNNFGSSYDRWSMPRTYSDETTGFRLVAEQAPEPIP